MAKQQLHTPASSVFKKLLSFLPASLPAKVYNTLAILPPLKFLMNRIILSLIPEKIAIPEGQLLLDQSDVAVSGALALGAFEKTEMDLFRKSVRTGSIVVDIGANIGYYSVIAGKLAGPGGKVFSYEPEERDFSFLIKNISINGLQNIAPLQQALSDKKGMNALYIDENNRGHHSFVQDAGKKKIALVTEDNSLRAFGSPKIDIIKMDIEGAEFFALEGMRETIAASPRLILFTEIYPKAMRRLGGNPLTFLQNLAGLGFSLSVIDEDKKSIEPLGDMNVFLHNFPKGESFKNIYAVKG